MTQDMIPPTSPDTLTEEPDTETGLQAIVLFRELSRLPDFPDLAERADQIHAAFSAGLVEVPSLCPENEAVEIRHLAIGGDRISLVHYHSPLPGHILSEVLNKPRVTEETRNLVKTHTSFAFLTVTSETEERDMILQTIPAHDLRLQAAISLTLTAATLATLDNALAVCWLPAKTILYARTLLEVARRIDDGILPLELWVNLIPDEVPDRPGEPHLNALHTEGLYPLTGREIEFGPSSLDRKKLAIHTLAVTSAVLQEGSETLVDGDILGMEGQETIRLRLKDEGTRPGIPVIELSQEHI